MILGPFGVTTDNDNGVQSNLQSSRCSSELTMTPLGGPFDLVSRVSKVGYGDYNRVSKGYYVDVLSQKGLQAGRRRR